MSYFSYIRRGTNLKDGLDTLKYFLFGLLFHCVHYICNGTRVFFQMLSFPCHQIRLIIFCCCPRRYKSCDHRHFIFCAGFNATITKLQIDTFTQKNIEYFSTYRVQFSHGITATHCYSSLWILLKHRNCSLKSLHHIDLLALGKNIFFLLC